ncbi:hypothetical protein GOBAR_AA24560 [Gossypium barbadense]|uniref:Uncharacterized protein n=1 Tax=Gossypium barbadense TaxID=3634 RepID=A0A2P5WYF8_GOSBA|nr:hypothetical protein GOBAR_AA24560 [Gossypium barbadense]
MGARIEQLEAELREVTALEISLYSVILEQALSLYMQPQVEGSCSYKTLGKLLEPASGNKQPGSFLIDLRKMAFEDAFQLTFLVRAGATNVVAYQLLQCVARLNVAMFYAILWESKNKIPIDPISNSIVDSKRSHCTTQTPS